ncbi:MAG: hypothetical protein QM473_03815, partial [Acidobacteriota bacterium]|nr:hypothetical protein [Acidobacteriota bacterium]
PKLWNWVEDNVEETFAFHCLRREQASEERWRNTTAHLQRIADATRAEYESTPGRTVADG